MDAPCLQMAAHSHVCRPSARPARKAAPEALASAAQTVSATAAALEQPPAKGEGSVQTNNRTLSSLLAHTDKSTKHHSEHAPIAISRPGRTFVSQRQDGGRALHAALRCAALRHGSKCRRQPEVPLAVCHKLRQICQARPACEPAASAGHTHACAGTEQLLASPAGTPAARGRSR